LNNTFIEEIDRNRKRIVISDFRPEKEQIVVGIKTPSLLEDPYDNQFEQQIGGDPLKYNRKREWRTFLYSDYIDNLYLTKLEKWLYEVEVPEELKELLKRLSLVYSKKRIEIFDAIYDSGGIEDVYII
ncbi:MAG: hypothetical protein ACXQTS_07745, partial [Candidatus Methanospirareceae archaeon]